MHEGIGKNLLKDTLYIHDVHFSCHGPVTRLREIVGFIVIVLTLSILTQFFRFTTRSFRDFLREFLRDSQYAYSSRACQGTHFNNHASLVNKMWGFTAVGSH